MAKHAARVVANVVRTMQVVQARQVVSERRIDIANRFLPCMMLLPLIVAAVA
jgi:hypothetical protein